MKRALIGVALASHALAHASASMWTKPLPIDWLVTPLLATAFVSFSVSALCIMRVTRFSRWWVAALAIGLASSMLWMACASPPFAMWGVLVNVAFIIPLLTYFRPWVHQQLATQRTRPVGRWRRRIGSAFFTMFGVAVLYASVVLLARSPITRWGSTSAERERRLPGDTQEPSAATYRLDHAITIKAPATAIWPWLVQLGQDRGGFYSYSWLERLFGVSIHNAAQIHSEWQSRAVGDTVFATQRSYLGGRAGGLGWRISAVEPNQLMVLENWGSFLLLPIDSSATRLIVRTRGYAKPNALAFIFGPFNIFVFEPAHFIMERAMLKGIKARAEHQLS